MAARGSRRQTRPVILGAAALLLFCALAIGIAINARRPELDEYVSPPLDASGRRLHVLIPTGWCAEITDRHGPKRLPLATDDCCWIDLCAPRPAAWWPRWLTSHWMKPEFDSRFTVIVTTGSRYWPPPPDLKSAELPDADIGSRCFTTTFRSADRTLLGGCRYARGDQAAFERTHRQVWQSIAIR
jgi:hypothetical protein